MLNNWLSLLPQLDFRPKILAFLKRLGFLASIFGISYNLGFLTGWHYSWFLHVKYIANGSWNKIHVAEKYFFTSEEVFGRKIFDISRQCSLLAGVAGLKYMLKWAKSRIFYKNCRGCNTPRPSIIAVPDDLRCFWLAKAVRLPIVFQQP